MGCLLLLKTKCQHFVDINVSSGLIKIESEMAGQSKLEFELLLNSQTRRCIKFHTVSRYYPVACCPDLCTLHTMLLS